MPARRRGPGTDLVLSVAILAAVSAAALALDGCTSASGAPQKQNAARSGTTQADMARTAVQADATSRGGGRVHLVDYTDNDGPDSTVILTGAIGDYGKAVSVNPDGSVNPEHDSQWELKLSHGTFRLDIGALDRTFVAAFAAQFPTNATTCSGTVVASRAVPIVAGSGTGAYQGVSGQFDLTITADEVDPTGSHCDGTAAYLSQLLITTGSGNVRVH